MATLEEVEKELIPGWLRRLSQIQELGLTVEVEKQQFAQASCWAVGPSLVVVDQQLLVSGAFLCWNT